MMVRFTLLSLTFILFVACAPSRGSLTVTAPTPAEHRAAEDLYNQKCASCHGERGAGTSLGPSFLNKIYEPSHHSDESFQVAVRQGVRPHHWQFGPMPAVPEVTPAQTTEITRYVRWLQQQVGIR